MRLLFSILISFSLFISCANDEEGSGGGNGGGSSDGYSTALSDDFNRSDEADLGVASPYTIATGSDGCALTNNQVQCISTGGSSGKALYNTQITGTTVKITADLVISGGDYNGSGSGAFLVLADNDDMDSATALYACGINEGQIAIRDESTILQTGTDSNIATDGKYFSVVLTIESDTITCAFTGTTTETITYSGSFSNLGYGGMIAGWYDGANKNYALFDNLVIEYK